MKRFLPLVALLATAAHAQWVDYTPADKYREVVYETLLFADYKQTMDIHNHPRLHEHNFALGPQPSKQKINGFFLLGAVTHPVITGYMPVKYRKYWQYGGIILETAVIIHNRKAGLTISF